MEDPEFDLIRAIADGDETAFEKLVRRYRNPVMTFVYRYVGDIHLAQDIVQEVFLRILKAAPRFKPRAKVSGWVFTIAYNLSVNELKRRKHRNDFHAEIAAGERDILGRPFTTHRTDSLNKEKEDRLMAALGKLPENQRAALLLRLNEGLSYAEIAKVLDVSVAGVESLIFRARSRLKQLVKASTGTLL
jgi:RNA polymerase sigma-70 factor (ECF subfamily)